MRVSDRTKEAKLFNDLRIPHIVKLGDIWRTIGDPCRYCEADKYIKADQFCRKLNKALTEEGI